MLLFLSWHLEDCQYNRSPSMPSLLSMFILGSSFFISMHCKGSMDLRVRNPEKLRMGKDQLS